MTHRRAPAVLVILLAGCASRADEPAGVVAVEEPQDEQLADLTVEATEGATGLGLVSAPPCFDNEFGPFAEGESCWDESSIVHVTYCQKLDGTKRELVRQILHCEEPNGFCVTLGDKPPWAYLCGPVRGFGKD